jgi:hypothetical protein
MSKVTSKASSSSTVRLLNQSSRFVCASGKESIALTYNNQQPTISNIALPEKMAKEKKKQKGKKKKRKKELFFRERNPKHTRKLPL